MQTIEAATGAAASPSAPVLDLTTPERFIDRELSWLAFNFRVLEEAGNPRHPLLERVRFLSISASNWDEFCMVRVAGLKAQVETGINSRNQNGLTPAEQLEQVKRKGAELIVLQRQAWDSLQEALRAEGIAIVAASELGKKDLAWLETRFMEQVFPVLTPLAVDPAAAFPFIPNLGFCLVLELAQAKAETLHALVPLPPQIDRFFRLPGDGARFVVLEDLIVLFLDRLYPHMTLVKSGVMRVIRDSVMEIDERAEDLVRTFETALKRRRRGGVVRLAINADIDAGLRRAIIDRLGVHDEDDVVMRKGILGLSDVKQLIVSDRPDLQFKPFSQRFPERVRDFGGDVFAAIRHKDFIVHHPYESFDVVVQFLTQAARDPQVVAIKQTLYRTSKDSPIIAALREAAEAGKQVTAVVEVKARFDEEANIRWAKDMENVGAHVVYGFIDKKIHAKASLVVRREGDGLRSYAHFGTGNYHPVTARIYTDLAFFTCDAALCRDAARLFNYVTGYDPPEHLEKLSISPLSTRKTLLRCVDEEIKHAKAGRPATIWLKMNALIDGQLIDSLYRASQAGVEVCAVVRGICGLRPQIPGLSDNIRIYSIVGRFLEHSRIYVFGNGHEIPSDHAKVFLSSADWMPRNMDRRVETLVPVENETVRRQMLDEIMVHAFQDDLQSWELRADGSYIRRKPQGDGFSSQVYFLTNPSLSGRGSALNRRRGKSAKAT